MKILRFSFAIVALFAMGSLQAGTTGDAALASANIGWQNWAFGTSLIATATAAIIIVSLNTGNEIQSTTH